MITVHAEACRDLAETVKKIHETGADAGVAVNPDTPLSAVTDVMDQVEMILIMSVYPGFGGQKYIPESRGSVRSAECWMKRDWNMCTFRSMAASTARPSMKSLRQVPTSSWQALLYFGSNIEQNVRELQEKISSYSKKAE